MKNFVYVVIEKENNKSSINNEKLMYIINDILKNNNSKISLERINDNLKETLIRQKSNSILSNANYEESSFMPPHFVLLDNNQYLKNIYRSIKELDEDFGIKNIDFIDVYTYRC